MSSINKKLRIGILGCSDIAYRKFLPALLKAKNTILTAVASRGIDKAKQFFPQLNYESMTYEKLLLNKNVDLIYISLPNHLHEEWTMKALENNKHVICEKPLGLSYESTKKMITCATNHSLLLYENIMYLHHPQHQQIKKIIDSGKIGKIKSLRSSFGFSLTDARNFRLDKEKGGGAFYDLIRYPLSAALYHLNGDLCSFKGFSFFRNGLSVGMIGLAITSKQESLEFSIGFEQQYESFYEIIGEKGKIKIDRAYTTPPDYKNLIQIISGMNEDSLLMPAYDHFQLMLEYVAQLILENKSFQNVFNEIEQLAQLADQFKEGCEEIHE